ncbi:very short patch repair endonuclease [Agrobacterium salinitolerans]|uniref:very short patch repair endonuclease n=1 Tax=Agrobacterium salinitolerans TaxID=1183413 RepID=UPI002FCE11F9
MGQTKREKQNVTPPAKSRRMPDTSPERSWVMSRVGQKNTKPEMIVRRLVHGMGYRYRLHRKNLPGSPDLVFASRRKVVFVHGCFWHGHADRQCKLSRPPKSRLDYWGPKLERNKERDSANEEKLKLDGWGVLIVWECQLRDREALESMLREFLGPPSGGEIPRDRPNEQAENSQAHP